MFYPSVTILPRPHCHFRHSSSEVRTVEADGNFAEASSIYGNRGIRAAVNVSRRTPVSNEPTVDEVYEMILPEE